MMPLKDTAVVERCLAAEEHLKNPVLQMLSRKRDAAFCISIVQTVFPAQSAEIPIYQMRRKAPCFS